MAEKFFMKNEQTNETKQGVLGFSWTVLFFDLIPPLCRGDFQTALLLFGLHLAMLVATPNFIFYYLTFHLPSFIFAFFYNQYYTNNLIKKGFNFAESPEKNNYANFLLHKPKAGRIIFCSIYTIVCFMFAFSVSRDMSFNIPIFEKINNEITEKPFTADEIMSAQVSDISPYGQLADIFNLMSDYTDLQREEKLNEITGKIIEWELPVYEISKEDESIYKLQISSGKNVGCIVFILATDDEDRKKLLSIKTGDSIRFKGKLTGKTFMRSIIIEPAFLVKSKLTVISGILDCGLGKYWTCNLGENFFLNESTNGINIFDFCKNGEMCEIKASTNDNYIEEIFSARSINSVDNILYQNNKNEYAVENILYSHTECGVYENEYYIEGRNIKKGNRIVFNPDGVAYEKYCKSGFLKRSNIYTVYYEKKEYDPDSGVEGEYYDILEIKK